MSIVAPITVAWQRVTNESNGETKEIETFSQLEPAIRRARDVILSARNTQNSKYRGSNPEAHLTLHPGEFQYGDALSQQDLDNIYITMLPGAITQDSTETFPPDSTTNVADMNSFASRVFFAETESEFIFDSDVAVRGDFSFQGNIFTVKLSGSEIQGGFRVESSGGGRGSSFLYDVSESEWISQNDTRVQGKLTSDQGIEISGETVIDGGGQPVQISGVGNYSVSSANYTLNATNTVSKNGNDFDINASGEYEVSVGGSFTIGGGSSGKIQSQNLELEGESISIESTSGDFNLTSSNSAFVSTPNGKFSVSGQKFESLADEHNIEASAGTAVYDDYNISAETLTTAISDQYNIASGDPSATFTVDILTIYTSDVDFNGSATTIKNLEVTESFSLNASTATFNTSGSIDFTSSVFSVDSNEINLNGEDTSVFGKNSLDIESDSEILIEASGLANPSISLASKLIEVNPTDQFEVKGSSQFEGPVSVAAGNNLLIEDNISAGGYIESPEVRASNTSSGDILFAGSSRGNVEGDANFTYNSVNDTVNVENINIRGTLDLSSLDVDSLSATSASIDTGSITSLDANTADFSSVQIDGIGEDQVLYVDDQGKLNGTFDLEFDPFQQTLSTRNLEVSSDVSIGGDFSLLTGTSVSEIRTNVRNSGASDDALVTESAIGEAMSQERSYGQETFSGSSSKKEFKIQHGFSSTPDYWNITATNNDSSGISHASANSSNIIVKYDTPPPSGSDNIVLNWVAIS